MRLNTGKLLSLYKLFRYNLKVTFSARYFLLLVAGLVYFVIFWLFHYFADPGEEFRGEHILNTFLSPPGVFLGILLGMQLVLQERDSRTIEVMFAISRSRFRVWVVKALTIYLAIFILLLFLAVLSYIFIAGFPFASVLLNAMVPSILFVNLTVLISVLTRSQNAAALLASIVLFLVFFTSGAWNESIFFPFLNPQSLADHVDPGEWLRILVENRILVLSLAFLLLALALQRMGRREKLL